MSSTAPKEEFIGLQLGDIIQIESPSNARLNNNIFIVNYIDPSLLRLINTESSDEVSINIADKKLSDESITAIILLDMHVKITCFREIGLTSILEEMCQQLLLVKSQI